MISTHDLLTRLLALAELAVSEALEFDYGDPEDRYIWRELQELKGLVATAMTQPEPEGPTDEEIMDLMPQLMHEDLASAARAMAAQAGTDNRNVAGMMRIILNHHAVDLARIVLARLGRPASEPVPEP
jgi:hypothetical protein